MSLLEKVIYGIFPRTCVFCDEVINDERGICINCEKLIEYVEEPKCKKCGKPVTNEEQEYCYDCTKIQHIYMRGFSTYIYNEVVKESIYRFKYHNRREYAKYYGESICYRFADEIKRLGIEAIIPVPIHRKKQLERGYNQAELIARVIGNEMKLPVVSDLLIRQKYTKPQKELSNSERGKNLENAFIVTENVVKCKKVLLVDDIYTTGSTVDACSKVLLEAGAESVYFVSISIGTGI